MHRAVGVALASLAFFAAPASADIVGFFPDILITAPETVNDPLVVLGAPDDRSVGIGDAMFVYSLGAYRLIDGPGPDLNVYEADFGAIEFHLMDVLVSNDNQNWVSIGSTMGSAVALEGDEQHGSAAHRKSFDLAGSGLSEAKYIRIQGLGTGAASGTSGFDLDAIGLVNWRVPAPSALALLAGPLMVARRRR